MARDKLIPNPFHVAADTPRTPNERPSTTSSNVAREKAMGEIPTDAEHTYVHQTKHECAVSCFFFDSSTADAIYNASNSARRSSAASRLCRNSSCNTLIGRSAVRFTSAATS